MCSGIFESHHFALSIFEKVEKKQDFEYLNITWHYQYQRQFPSQPDCWLFRSYEVDSIPLNLTVRIKQDRSIFFFLSGIPVSYTTVKEIITGYLLSKKISCLDEFRI